MIIQYGLMYDNKQNIIVPPLPKKLGPWNPPKPGEGIEGFDGTPNAILRHVVYNRLPSETKQDLLNSWQYHETKRRIHDRRGVLIRERIVFLKRARVYAAEFVYALPDTSSIEFKLWMERQCNGGLTRAELLAQQQAERDRYADYHSPRWNPAKHRAKQRAKWARQRARKERLKAWWQNLIA